MEIKVNKNTTACEDTGPKYTIGKIYGCLPDRRIPGWPNPWDNSDPWESVDKIFDKSQFKPDYKFTQVDNKTRKLEVKVPGYKPEEISVTLEGNMLKVEASTKRDGFFDSISHTHMLGIFENVASADLEDGMLTIILKTKNESSKKIPINKKK